MRGRERKNAWAERNVESWFRLRKSQLTQWDVSEQLVPIRRDLQLLRITIFLDSHFVQ